MMQDISTTLKGRIGSVPTMKHIKGDTCVTTFRLAIPRWRFTVDTRTGNASYVEDGAYWYTIETWDKLADNVVRCCCKGDPVIVVARPVPNAWVDANGQIRSSIVFRASAVGHDMAKGMSRYTKNGAHSAGEPAGGSLDDPFSTRPTQPSHDQRAEVVAGCDAPTPVVEAPGEGTHGAVGAQAQHSCVPADELVHAPTDDTRHGQDASSQGASDDQCPQLRDGCVPADQVPHMHDGSEEHSSDPRVQALSRFDYSAVGPSRRSPEETAQPLVSDGQAPSLEADAPDLDDSDDF